MNKARVLVVEDDRVIAESVVKALVVLGYLPLALASSGEEAIRQTGDLRPDLVLMDIHLQGPMLGTTAAEHIVHRFDIPVVYLTAYSDEETLRLAKRTRPFGFVSKPFNVQQLDVAIEMALYLHRTEKQLRISEARYRALVRNIPDSVVVLFDRQLRCAVVDGAGLSAATAFHKMAQDRPMEEALAPEVYQMIEPYQRAALAGRSHLFELTCDDRIYEARTLPIRDARGDVVAGMLMLQDITARKQSEWERERLIAELRRSLEHIKVLRGLLPICMHCKRIRDDQGYWQQLEVYIRDHSEAEFTHGLCPECARKFYPQIKFPSDE